MVRKEIYGYNTLLKKKISKVIIFLHVPTSVLLSLKLYLFIISRPHKKYCSPCLLSKMTIMEFHAQPLENYTL